MSKPDMDSEYRSPFGALVVNLFFPGYVFWQFGAKIVGGSLLALSFLAGFVEIALGLPEGTAGALHLALGLATGLIAFFVYSREHLQRH